MKNKWNEMNFSDKILIIARLVLSVIVIILAALQIFGIMDKAINYAVPLLAVISLIQSLQEWKQYRVQAVLDICVSVFIFIVSYVVWFVK